MVNALRAHLLAARLMTGKKALLKISQTLSNCKSLILLEIKLMGKRLLSGRSLVPKASQTCEMKTAQTFSPI